MISESVLLLPFLVSVRDWLISSSVQQVIGVDCPKPRGSNPMMS